MQIFTSISLPLSFFQDQESIVKNLEYEISKLESDKAALEDTHKSELESLQGVHKSELETLEKKYKNDLDEQKNRLSEDISCFKKESEKILKENQNLLLKGFETDKGSLVKNFEIQLESLTMEKNRLESDFNAKVLELKELHHIFAQLSIKDEQSQASIQKLHNGIKDLENRLKLAKNEVEHYQKLLAETQVSVFTHFALFFFTLL